MNIEKIVNEAIPISKGCCRLIRAHKEWQRRIMRERIEQGKDLHLVPEKVLKKCRKLLNSSSRDSEVVL